MKKHFKTEAKFLAAVDRERVKPNTSIKPIAGCAYCNDTSSQTAIVFDTFKESIRLELILCENCYSNSAVTEKGE